MIGEVFVASLAGLITVLFYWGFRTLPAERWQMIASVPLTRIGDGLWRSVNLTYYGFFSATGIAFGIALAIVLLGAMRVPLVITFACVAALIGICVPASRLVAAFVEKKRDTFTIAGAAFLATLLIPPAAWLGERALSSKADYSIHALPLLAAATISYALAEAIGRLACISFGCCYGMPLRDASPWLARFFRRYPLTFYGTTKKAAYASGFEKEPLIPVQALTSVIFAFSGLVGLGFFLTQNWKMALIVPAAGTWGWRAIAESLRADFRGSSRISAYQVMSLVALSYICGAAAVLPSAGSVPDLAAGFSQFRSVALVGVLQAIWVSLFLYYGRSRVTGSVVFFHVKASDAGTSVELIQQAQTESIAKPGCLQGARLGGGDLDSATVQPSMTVLRRGWPFAT